MSATMRAICHGVAAIFALALLLFQSSPATAEAHIRHSILIVDPFDRAIPLSETFRSGLISAFGLHDLNTFEIYQENLDLLNGDESVEYLDSLSAFLKSKYASKRFDAIVAIHEMALSFLLKHCDFLSPGTPIVVACLSKEEFPYEGSGRKIIRVSSGVEAAEQTVDLILHLQPDLRRIYIVCGTRPFEQVLWGHMPLLISKYKNGPEFVFATGNRYEELVDALEKADRHDAILVLTFSKDQAGGAYLPQAVAAELSQTAGCPVYGIADTYMGHGIVGGSMLPVNRQGAAVGRTIRGLFETGAAVAEKEEIPPLKQVDARQMARWNLSERNLPEGYEVVNRAPSLLRDYRGHVTATLVFFCAQSALIFRLLMLGRIRRAGEKELRRTCKDLEENQAELNRSRALQEKALENLQESEATLQSILTSIPVGVLLIDAGTRTVRMANRAAAELLGMSLEGIPGSPCPNAFEPFIHEGINEIYQYTANASEDCLCDARNREVYVLKTVDRVSIGGRTHLIGCLLDITRMKAAEREAREREEQLVHADKMISLGTMAAGIAHEVHNPNNFILLNAPVLKMAWESAFRRLDEYAEEHGDFLMGKLPYSRAKTYVPALVDGIIEGAKRIRTIVRDMKEFVSRKSSGDREMVDINAVLRSSLNLLANKLKNSTDNLRVEYGESIPMVEANAQRLEQVAINLILNGAESLKNREGALIVRSYYEPERAGVVMEVKDEGVGIETENLKRVFDPFFSTKRETGGTGLGLAISREIIEAYGGRITIVSTPGEGTTAILELPATSEGK